MTTQPNAMAEELQRLLNRYRNLDEGDQKQVQAFIAMVQVARIPAYHREVLVAGLLTPNEGETVLTLHQLHMQEEMRHAESMLNIERAVMEVRMNKRDPGRPERLKALAQPQGAQQSPPRP